MRRSVEGVIERSMVLREMIERAEVGLIGAMYDVASGAVQFMDDTWMCGDVRHFFLDANGAGRGRGDAVAPGGAAAAPPPARLSRRLDSPAASDDNAAQTARSPMTSAADHVRVRRPMRRHRPRGALVALTAAVWAQGGQPPRGASGPPEHAKVAPVNNLPNPYETVRNFGTLPDGRKWGSVSADPRRRRRQARLGR